MRYLYFVIFFLLLQACSSVVNIPALAPAAIRIPDPIQKVATANRFLPASNSDKFKDILEGIFTGEGIGVDKAGANEAVMVLGQSLTNNSPRFQVSQANLQLLGRTREFFLPPLNPQFVQETGRQIGADALVVLEAFDSDLLLSKINFEKTVKENGVERKIPMIAVTMQMKVVTGFRMYDVGSGLIIDQAKMENVLSWKKEGITELAAKRLLPLPNQCVLDVARLAGDQYARRIAPSRISISRTYYTKVKKDAVMQQAKVKAQVMDWQGAAELWSQALQNPNPKVAGKACYNLGVAREVQGDLERALDYAKKAAYDYHLKPARNYILQLNQRLQAQQAVNQQLESLPVDGK